MQRVPKDVWNLIFHEIDNEDVKSWNQVCQCFRQIGQKWESETITKLKAKFTDKEQIRSRNSHECYLCAENCKHVPTVTIYDLSKRSPSSSRRTVQRKRVIVFEIIFLILLNNVLIATLKTPSIGRLIAIKSHVWQQRFYRTSHLLCTNT